MPSGYAKALGGRIRQDGTTLGRHGRVLAAVVSHALLTGRKIVHADVLSLVRALRRAGHVRTAAQLEGVVHKANPSPGFVEYTLPAYWASYLINGDDSGIQAWQRKEIDEFLKREKLGPAVGVSEETYFKRYNDYNMSGGDVATYTFEKGPRGKNPPSQTSRRRYAFFKRHAGGIVGEAAKGAKLLADAEAWAADRGVEYEWAFDLDADRSWEEEAGYDGPGEYETVLATDPETGLTESLGGIVDADNNYRRVIEAELALELMNRV